MTTNNIARFARVFAVLGFSVLSLAACAVDSEEAEQPTDQTSQALANNGGGPSGNSFSCDVDTDVCTCDKEVEGDCDGMRSLCQAGDLPGFDTCVGGWLIPQCSCHAQMTTNPKKPITVNPIFGSSGGIKFKP